MTDAPSVSAVIPCYNGAPYLRETLDSTLRQTCPPLEVIVVDDGSTDESAAIAASYGPPVHLIRQENQGESVARNRGMDEARGDWVALLDADDRWLPRKLERQLAALGAAPGDTVCVYSDFIVFGSVPRRTITCPLWPVLGERRVRLLTNPWVLPSTSLVRKSVGAEVRFPSGISRGEDQVFWMRLYDRGTFVHVPEPLIEYRKSAGQQTSQQGHGFSVVAELWSWVKQHPEAFTPAEFELARRVFAEILVVRHDHAYWQNDRALVDRARALYRDLVPGPEPLPALFERGEPSWTMRTAHHAWNATLDAMPRSLRQTLLRISRLAVDRVKRSGAQP
jgi:glycosyltransferase involved in cell wall biosynthesis